MSDIIKEFIDLSVKKELNERKKEEATKPKIFYHGTASSNLKSILSKGMLANPDNKHWDEESSLKDASIGSPSLESLKGSYWTRNFMTAYSAARNSADTFGGNRLFVISQISPKETLPDEDNIAGLLETTANMALSDPYGVRLSNFQLLKLLPMYIVHPGTMDEAISAFEKRAHDKFGLPNQPFNKEIVKQFLEAHLGRVVAHIFEKKSETETKQIFYTEYEREKRDATKEEVQNAYERAKVEYTVPEMEREYKIAQEAFLRYYRKTRMSDQRIDASNNRYMKDLGFTGRSKIILIVELIKAGWDEPDIIKIMYKDTSQGSMANQAWEQFREDYRQSIGPYFNVV